MWKVIKKILCSLFGWFCPEPQPPDPPIEYEFRDVCVILPVEEKLVHTYCPDSTIIRQKRYIKGTEPTDWCKVHKKPPDPPVVYPDPIPQHHAGYLGIFLWFVRIWDELGKDEAVKQAEETIHEMALLRYIDCDFFVYVSDNDPDHAHLNFNVPWLSTGNGYEFDLTKENPVFWDKFETFIGLFDSVPMDPIPQAFMFGYGEGPFRHNVNGIDSFWQAEAFEIQAAFVERMMNLGVKRLKPMNEFRHGGSTEEWHKGAEWHRRIVEEVALKYTKINKIRIDNSLSEAPQIHLLEAGLECGKPNFPGETHGNDAYNRADLNRIIQPETHTFSHKFDLMGIIHSFEELASSAILVKYEGQIDHDKNYRTAEIEIINCEDYDGIYEIREITDETFIIDSDWKGDASGKYHTEKLYFLFSNWQWYWFHGDGSDKGTGWHIPGTDFKQGNIQETYEAYYYGFKAGKEAGKQFHGCHFPMGSFMDNAGNWKKWIENYDMTGRAWTDPVNGEIGRAKAIIQAWEDVYEA